jgi:hypothetical protein
MSKIFIIFIIVISLTSCQSAKDALTLKKKSNADEFLVEKKSPLVLPPDYGKLPLPVDEQEKLNDKKNQDEINILLGTNQSSQTTNSNLDKNSSSIENSILKKIK